MAVPTKTQAQTLIETVWGNNFFDSLPPKWKSTLKMKRYKTPGVGNGSLPDEIGTVDLDHLMDEIVATSQVTTNRTNELEKITEKIQVALLLTTITNGQDYDPEFDLVIPFTEHLAINGAEVGNARKEIRPLNSILSEVKTLDLSAFDAVLTTYKIEFPNTTSIEVPDFLNSLQVVSETSVANGDSYENYLTGGFAGEHSLTIPSRATAQGSATITKKIVPIITPFYGGRRTTRNFIFFLLAPVTATNVTDKLDTLAGLTVIPWVTFQPRPVTIVVITKHVSMQLGASLTINDSAHGTGVNSGAAHIEVGGTSLSRALDITTETIRIPPTLHGNLTLDLGTTESAPIDITVQASGVGWGTSVLTRSTSGETDKTATVSVQSFGLTATPGVTSLPNSGLLLVGINARVYKYGYVMIQAECIDASTL